MKNPKRTRDKVTKSKVVLNEGGEGDVLVIHNVLRVKWLEVKPR